MCSPTTKHDLGITLTLDCTLTIEFPHEDWAVIFLDLLENSAHKNTCKPRLRKSSSHGTCVRLDLPESLDRVHLRKAPGAETHELTFTFAGTTSAQTWIEGLGGSGLWEVDPDGEGDRLTFPLIWSHKDYRLACRKRWRDEDKNGGGTPTLEEGEQRSKETGKDEGHHGVWRSMISRFGNLSILAKMKGRKKAKSSSTPKGYLMAWHTRGATR